MPLELRPYQRAAVDAISTYFSENQGNPLVVIPTAGGKSLVIAEFIREAIEQWPDTRILILTHVRELIAQNFQELISYWPSAPAGIYSAGLGKRDIRAQVLFAGIQSIHSKAYNLQKVDLVLVDEAHLIPRSSNTTYRKFLDDLRQINPYIKIVGFTATPFRLDSGRLHIGDDAIFSDVAYEANVKDLIDDGYLCPPVTIPAKAQIDTSNIGTRAGEFIAGQLEAAADDPETVRAVVDEICQHGQGRKGWIVFGCGVGHCTDLRNAIRARGYSAEAIFGDTPNGERDAIIANFKRQNTRCLVSMGVLTTGFNAKHVDLIAVARPTKSTGLWIQIVGRGTRLYPGKENCLVLDFGGNIARHGPIDAPLIKDKKKGSAEPEDMPQKVCPQCETKNHISARQCVGCGFEFPDVVHKISTVASQLDILSGVVRTEWLDVSEVFYHRHKKDGKPPSVCVTYSCGLAQHREWLCPEHTGFPKAKFVQWWNKRLPGAIDVPATVDHVLSVKHMIPKPTQIAVRPAGKFSEIVGVRFEQPSEV